MLAVLDKPRRKSMAKHNLHKSAKETPERKRPGPKPEVLKIEGNWEDAVKLAMQKKKPPGGWPK